jgi:CDGSH-type Zn-finger protein
MAIKMLFTPNGSIVVGGDLSDLTLTDPTGRKIDVSGETKIFLCRCGASKNKPFCDDSHLEIGFQAADPAGAP